MPKLGLGVSLANAGRADDTTVNAPIDGLPDAITIAGAIGNMNSFINRTYVKTIRRTSNLAEQTNGSFNYLDPDGFSFITSPNNTNIDGDYNVNRWVLASGGSPYVLMTNPSTDKYNFPTSGWIYSNAAGTSTSDGSRFGPANVAITATPNNTILYADNFVGWPTYPKGFTTRQFFTSGSAGNVNWGNNMLENSGGNKQFVCYFDCMKDKYPAYVGEGEYGEDAIVYGGIYGHALFRRTGGFGNQGDAPNILHIPSGTSDGHWTRFRPALRTIAPGATLTVTLSFTLQSPGNALASNGVRFALLDSTISGGQNYLNEDNLGLSDSRFGGHGGGQGYRGYMATFAGQQKLFTRTDTTSFSLTNTITGAGGTVWAENFTANLAGLALDTKYQAILKITCPSANPATLAISSTISGGQISGPGNSTTPTITYTDSAPNTFSFDTLAAYYTTAAAASLKIENVIATYDGPSRDLFISEIIVTGSSFAAANGRYVRTINSGAFTKIGGTAGSIFDGGDGWYIFSVGTGNVARNESALGTGTWAAKEPGYASGISAEYRYAY